MSQAKLEKRKAALAEWIKYVDTLTPEEADILIKPIKDYLDNHPDNQWLPFDPNNIPTPNKEYMLLLKEGGHEYFFSEYTSNINNGKLYWHACYGDDHLDEKRVNECYGATYKLIKL